MTLPHSSFADGVTIPRVIVGGWQLSTGHRKSPDSPDSSMDALVELVAHGCTAFDCADIYTGVEELFGALRTRVHRRLGSAAAETLRFHTKLVPDRTDLSRVDRAYVERIVDRSLARLGTERLDLVQFAWWDYSVPGYVEAAVWLDDLRRAGKIQHVGVTNFNVPRLTEILQAGVQVAANQLQFSVLDRRPEQGMRQLCLANEMAMLCYGSLAGGFLSDRYLGAPEPGADLENRSLTKYQLIIEDFGGWSAFQALLSVLRTAANELGVDLAQVAVAALLAEPGVTAAIVGMSRPARFLEAATAAQLSLPTRHLAALRDLAAVAPGPTGDCFDLERAKDGRHAAVMKYDLNKDGETA